MTRSSHSDHYSINKMKKKKKEKFEVFEFDDNDHVERFSKRFSCQKLGSHGSGTKKNTKKSRDHSPINKYHFLLSFARGTETVDRDSRNESIDVDDEGRQCAYSVMSPNSCQLGDGGINMEDAYLISSSSTHKSKQFGRLSSEMSSLPISTFCSEANQIPMEKQVIEPDYGGSKIDDKNMTIKIFPDFIVYQDIYSMESCLTFSCHCIKIEGSPFSGTGKTFYFEWAIDDIINIESNWSGLVETARVTINLKSNNSRGVGNAIKTSGVEQLQFSVYDPRWVKGQEAIKTLDMRYKDKWNIDFECVFC
ncbi:hypothetical protein PanWU01x14_319680 [Parasponia andersonii]|uniref:Probable ubiquitin-like-specific protease 2A/B PH domain-containing protein n=1 Tax=Parasponia andersonii TaxID=3476 RepID=A0A2P5ALU9_PARAD|nr:hypothetical protein PanWU01x14_319680 [Parasponia andersonii]